MKKVAIIGAGLSGVVLARFLRNYAKITIFEKARGVGGRLATRRADLYSFDHGAQYFTVRTQLFSDFIQPLISAGIIKQWDARYARLDRNRIIERNHWSNTDPRYVGAPGMSSIVKYLSEGLDIHLETHIIALEQKGKWHLIDQHSREYPDFDWVISTITAPQAKELLPISFQHYVLIKDIQMRSCFALMLGFSNIMPLDFEAADIINSDVSWIAVNSYKPARGTGFSLIVHSSYQYAENHIDDAQETVIQHLMDEASHIIGYNAFGAEHVGIHKWRYAQSARINEDHRVFIDHKNRLAACGDWCIGNHIEGAFLSAYKLALQVKEEFL